MAKIVKSETKNVVPEPFNSLLPGPTKKHTDYYSDGSSKSGYGNSKSQAKNNARKK